ncbi:hypothetical protein BG015_006634 [Linnemannia schmuckeri]|uniref:Uncharacterized protein n=1 Tax=Linnemannia schmuckeri TaxID=64567 RepID=A0A9P5S9V8_9FUNG|nr:hypothetical protein BG015_006634 [Linnemannia schmuckeri]
MAPAVDLQLLVDQIIVLGRKIEDLEVIEGRYLSMLQTQTADGISIFSTTLIVPTVRDSLSLTRLEICNTAMEHCRLINNLRLVDEHLATVHNLGVWNTMLKRQDQLLLEESAYLADQGAFKEGNLPNLQNTRILIEKVREFLERDPTVSF